MWGERLSDREAAQVTVSRVMKTSSRVVHIPHGHTDSTDRTFYFGSEIETLQSRDFTDTTTGGDLGYLQTAFLHSWDLGDVLDPIK